MTLKEFFASLGKGFVSVGKYLIKRTTDDQLTFAVVVVRQAALRFIENNARREWAVRKLMEKLPISESLARWLIETAVQHVKAEAAEAIEKAGEAAKHAND